MKALKCIALTAAVVGFTAAPAYAAVQSFSATITEAAAPFTTTVGLEQFNTELGTLTGVALTLINNASGTVELININAVSRSPTRPPEFL